MRSAVYSATRNLYADMMPSIKSLIKNSNVEKIYLLLEDDEIGYWLPEICEVVNVSGQKWFSPGGPNYGSSWSYMVLLRAVYHRIFPCLDRIFSIDVDTIVDKDISHLWDVDLTGYFLMGVRETTSLATPEYPYRNAGVMMLNLDLLRKSGRGDDVAKALRNRRWAYPEQDAFNAVCGCAVLDLPREYNAGKGTLPYGEPIIRHWMGEHDIWLDDPLVEKYRSMSWEEVLKR